MRRKFTPASTTTRMTSRAPSSFSSATRVLRANIYTICFVIWCLVVLQMNLSALSRHSDVDVSVKLNEQHRVPLESQLKTLVVVIGNLRGGEVAWESLYKNLLDANKADLALLIGETRDSYRNASIFHRAKHVWTIQEYDDWADAIDKINGTAWRNNVLPFLTADSEGILGGVKNYTGSGAIIFMMRYFLSQKLLSTKVLDQYDRFVITRADHYYLCQHDMRSLSNEYIWLPRGEDYSGITDRHIIVSRRHILAALDILPPVLRNPQAYADLLGHRNPEQLIEQRWREEGLLPLVRRFDRVMFTCGETGDSTRWKSLGGEVREGVRLKYEKEYKASYDTCGICRSPFFWVWRDSGRTMCLADYIPFYR